MSIVRATGSHESAREARLAVGRDRAAAGQRANATVAAGRAAAAPERPVRGRQLRAQGGTIIKHDGVTGPGFSLGWSLHTHIPPFDMSTLQAKWYGSPSYSSNSVLLGMCTSECSA